MNDSQRDFLDELLTTASPSGFEHAGQQVWMEYVETFADEVRMDAYGNAVAVHHGENDTEIAFAGHADEIGLMVRAITNEGFLKLTSVGGTDKTVTRGQHVTVHGEKRVPGVIGQTAIHLRNDDDSVDDIEEQHVDIGVDSRAEAAELVEVGDPITVSGEIASLHGTRLSARGMDNRIGVWAAAEGLRRAAERDADATVYAIATVQEEIGFKGARMVGFDLTPDAFVVVDVTHATDSPSVPSETRDDVDIGAGPVIARGSANHPRLVEHVRDIAETEGIDVQLQAAGSATGTDADAFYTARGGVPSLNVGLPNRYMHTPVELIDTDDLDAIAALLGAVGAQTDNVRTLTTR
ncbi:M20/M25/M40 family metallo-hydrolase [Halocatena salina]|uniref:M20/M25/M40 family metallo-hydrolase n=1 Tax=Halocatena salina TaxID=2934340 RepID=A0A8U0A6V3_9EURY|nr:M20/M25/M40 family metallo-hydrolase [Halocatena salina]UPM43693.1 M20/M25/M40 family metallo-hydrolase [Halocatena salina]